MVDEFKEPWVVVGKFASNLVVELEREIVRNHPLFGRKVQAIAQRTDSDDVLFAVECDAGPVQYAVVHLTWSGEPELDTRWPDTKTYESFEEWSRDRMMPDHQEFVGS